MVLMDLLRILQSSLIVNSSHGRNAGYPAPPVQIPTMRNYRTGLLPQVKHRNVDSFTRLSPIPTAMDLIMKYIETFTQPLSLLPPCYTINSDRRIMVQCPVGTMQSFDVNVMQQIGKS